MPAGVQTERARLTSQFEARLFRRAADDRAHFRKHAQSGRIAAQRGGTGYILAAADGGAKVGDGEPGQNVPHAVL